MLNQNRFLSNKMYNQLKCIAQIILPAFGALYFIFTNLLNLPSAEEVVGAVIIIDVFLGLLLTISTKLYNLSEVRFDGAIHLGEIDGDQRSFHLELPITAGEIEEAQEIVLKVNHPT